MNKIYKQFLAGCVFSAMSALSIAAENDPLVGKWKTVDDRTGYSRADVEIRKKADGTYEGVIVTTRNVPGTDKMGICSNCPGELKNKPFIGLPFIWDFKQDPKNPREYQNGKVLDPIGGKISKKAKQDSVPPVVT